MPIPRSLACAALLALACLPAAAEDGKPEKTEWLVKEADAGNVDRAAYLQRVLEIVDDLNTARKELAGVEPLELDLAASEGHYRHARYLLHHMKDAHNSGGVADFNAENEDELATTEGRKAGRVAIFAVKYLEKGVPARPAIQNWIPSIGYRLPLVARSAKKVYVGLASAPVTEGEWQGYDWAIVVLSTDGDFRHFAARMRSDPANVQPVVLPRDGATGVPLEIEREGRDVVPPSIGRDSEGRPRKVGFPITVSYFSGAWIATGTTAQLFEVEQVEKEEKKERKRPGKKRKKKKKKGKVEYETRETERRCHVSTPTQEPLLGKAKTNLNSIVVIPEDPLEPGTTYRVKLEVFLLEGKETKRHELVTTFTTKGEE